MKNAEKGKFSNLIRMKKKVDEKKFLGSISLETLNTVQNFKKTLVYFNQNNINPLFSNTPFNESITNTLKLSSELLQNQDLLNYYRIRLSRNSEIEPVCSCYLRFDSNFESGNLLKAYQHSEKEFVLVLREDFSNQNFSHWFHFSVKPQKFAEVTFHIVNIQKLDSALAEGMQIVAKVEGKWQRAGKNIKFRKNVRFKDYVNGQKTFVLSFTFDFSSHSKTFFSYTFPYTFSDLEKLLKWVKKHKENHCKIENLCKSLSGLDIPVITITNNVSCNTAHKKSVVFIGRVHPCEAPSSYIISGLVHFLLSNNEISEILRNTFTFIIIPMINPDGVKFGNSRCSLLGVDLNRRWSDPAQSLHPEVFYVKKMIKSVNEKNGVFLCCDIHSHAKKKNVFMYGCNSNKSEKNHKEINLKAKIVPTLLSQHNVHFSLKNSHFKMNRSKESTARIVMFKQLSIINSYTVETSFFGSEFQKIFEISDWEKIGEDLARLSLSFYNTAFNPSPTEKPHSSSKRIRLLTPKQKARYSRGEGYLTPYQGKLETEHLLNEHCEKLKRRARSRIQSSRGKLGSKPEESNEKNLKRPFSTTSDLNLYRISVIPEKVLNKLPSLR